MFRRNPITVVEHTLTVRGVVGSIPHGGNVEIFLVPVSAPRLVQQRLWCVLSTQRNIKRIPC